MTSDVFFAQNRQYFDIVFVDGLHEAHQVLKDINNALRWLAPNGTIVLHDCNPLVEISSRYPEPVAVEGEEILGWNGDTWKAAVSTRLQDGLEIVIVDVDQGVGLIRRRLNRHRMDIELESKILEDGIDKLDYSFLRAERERVLRLITLSEMREWLDYS
jgi:SAM-dependent methyltransferase